MSIQLNPTQRAQVEGLNLNQAAASRANAYDAANSSLVSMAQTEEGVSDFFNGVWNVVTWPFRTVASLVSGAWNWITGASSAAPAAKAAGTDDFDAIFKGKKKIKADDFRAAFETLSDAEKKAFKTMLWVAGGHRRSGHGHDWSQKFIDKKKFDSADSALLRRAHDMMGARESLKAMAEKLGEKGLKDRDVRDIKKECYDKKNLPDIVKQKVKELGHILGHGAAHSGAAFEATKGMAKAYKRACEILAENNFVLLPDVEGRRELAAMDRHLQTASTRHGGLDAADVAAQYGALGEKSAALLAEVIGIAAHCPGKGAAYLKGTYVNRHGAVVPADHALVHGALQAILQFDRA